jgi:hypothetical protein
MTIKTMIGKGNYEGKEKPKTKNTKRDKIRMM